MWSLPSQYELDPLWEVSSPSTDSFSLGYPRVMIPTGITYRGSLSISDTHPDGIEPNNLDQ
jgi:hypothetical protein